MTPHFFGLGDKSAPLITEEVFMVCYYGRGGFNWNDVYYLLPVYKRKFIINLINRERERKNKAEQEAIDKAKSRK